MTIDLYWADENQTAIVIQPVGKWNWEALYNVVEEARHMFDMAGGSHKIHTIVDWSKNASYPADTIVHGRSLLNKQHPRQGMYVFVGFNSIVNGMYQLFTQVNSKTLKNFTPISARTLDEAMVKLAGLSQSGE